MVPSMATKKRAIFGGLLLSCCIYFGVFWWSSLTRSGTAVSVSPANSAISDVAPAASCSGTCYYVSPAGHDSNPGTSPGTPWKTLAKVQSSQEHLQPGDSVLLQRGGVWYEQLDIINLNGSSGFPIVIGNYGGGNLPVIDGGQTKSSSGRNYCIDAINTIFKWITVDGIECRNTYMQGVTFQSYSGAGSNGVGLIVQNSYIHHDGLGACTSCGPTPAGDPGGYVNQLDAQLTTGVKFLNNTLDHCGGHNCIQVHYDIGNPVVSGNVVGTVEPYCNHNCIDLKGSIGALVIHNVVTCPGCSRSTAAFYTENTGYHRTRAATIAYIGNVVNNVPIGFQAERGGRCTSSPCSIELKYYNNTIYQPSPSQYNFMDTSCTNHTLDIQKNIVDGGQTDIHGNCSLTWDYNDDGGMYAISGNPVGRHDLIRANPQYSNAEGGDFEPHNATIVTYGARNPITSATHLGAVPASTGAPGNKSALSFPRKR